jgi:hypothetical protein
VRVRGSTIGAPVRLRRGLTLRSALILVALIAFAASAAGIDVRGSHGAQTTGDEPHYLLSALSLGEDGNLDVSDEIARRAYLPFHGEEILTQAEDRGDGRLIEPHDPLLPAILAVPMVLGGWVLAKIVLAGFAAALAAVMLWTAVHRMGVPLPRATAVVALLSATAPLAVYGSEVYPELPAALAVAVALAALMGPLGRGGLWALGLGAVGLPWLSVKYMPVALVLAAIGLWLLWRSGRPRTAGVLVGALAAAAIAHVAVHLAIYDGLTPYASGSHFTGGELTVVGDDPHYLGRSRRLVGLMVDRDFGLAAWQPAWLLLVPAVAALAARRPRGAGALGLTLLAGWLMATFVALTMQGWWFPGRQLVVVLPAAVLAIAWWAGGGGRRLAAVVSLGALGLLTYAWLLVEGLSGRVTWAADLQTTADPLYRGMRYALPDYLHVTAGTWLLHGAWLAAGLAVGAVTYARERTGRVPRGLHAPA